MEEKVYQTKTMATQKRNTTRREKKEIKLNKEKGKIQIRRTRQKRGLEEKFDRTETMAAQKRIRLEKKRKKGRNTRRN